MQDKNTSPLRAKYEMVLLDENGEVIKDRSAQKSEEQKRIWERKKLMAQYQKAWKYKPTKE